MDCPDCVHLARNSGFCFGVKRAIQIAQDSARERNRIFTLGPLIHNPQMVARLKESGIQPIDDVTQIGAGETVIIRSHGVTRETLEYMKIHGIRYIDATCPYVSKTQQDGRLLSNEGYTVLIIGNREHPEVIALKSYVDGENFVVISPDDFPKKKFGKLGIISQTTQPLDKLKEIVHHAIPRCEELRVFNTICNATLIRQNSTRKLAARSDLMIVIGGRNSSNTKMLAHISSEIVETHHIETASEIDRSWLERKKRIGITAGASTPDWLILDVYNQIIKYTGDRERMVENVEDIPGSKEE